MLQTLSDTVRATIRAIRRREIEDFVQGYSFPAGLRKKIGNRLGFKNEQSSEQVLLGLKDYLLLCLDGRDMVLGMPSQAVDAAWHEFILYTRDYTRFCQRAYGHYLHHVPNEEPEVLGSADYWGDVFEGGGRASSELGNTWFVSCLRRRQDPRRPRAIPRLFTLDFELGIGYGRLPALEDLAVLRIPPCFIETEPGRYRYSAWKNRKKHKSNIWWGPETGPSWGATGSCGGSAGSHHGGHGHSGGGHDGGAGCGGGGGCSGGGGGN